MSLRATLLLSLVTLSSGACSGPDTRGNAATGIPGRPAVPLWVQVESCEGGRPVVRDYSVLKMPDERLYWAISYRDGDCRIFGAILHKDESRAPDDCDVRFRSKDPLPKRGQACPCTPGRYDLQEGRATSEKCCERHPESVHCVQPATPGAEPSVPDVEPEPAPEE
ncbi:MAG: hypothetical protein FJ098_15425 [Deltaproteobacteria bacterium]|nr:hypothetical protein [Deltaproteobacteria bacterium]